jgi:DNA-binding transcriptional MerR regulator
MLMAELSRSSGVPVATIKYYLREGLLPPGAATSATRAEYDEAHLRRLRLTRALEDPGRRR